MSVSPVNVGDVLAGKYQVERVLGVGGMGVVVSAKHLTLGERFAIKFLLPQALARADVVARFIREGQAAARIRSEHVARVTDVGTLDGGEPYLVMEYLEGNDLGAVLRKEGPLSIELTVEYVLHACLALADAHAISIVHRDLKPSNLFLIRSSDGSPTIKIIDFGISKVAASPDGPVAAGDGEMTQTAVMMGSPLYMAPEQMASARDVDGRADIWSLGIILHTLLTGSPPFKAPSVMQVYELITQGAPPIRKARADVPEGLETAILRCLEKDRRRRFANVGELADAIAEFGPPHARFTADKVKRIVRGKSSHGSTPPPVEVVPQATAVTPPSMSSAAGAVAGTKQGLGDPPPAARESKGAADAKKIAPESPSTPDGTPPPVNPSPSPEISQPTGSSLAIDPHATDGPWDQRTHPPTRGRSRIAVIAAGVGAVVLAAPLAFFLLRGQQGPAAPVAPASDSGTAAHVATAPSATPALTASGPSVAPATTPAEVTLPAPEPSASASAPIRTPIRRVTPPTPQRPKCTGDDCFNTQGVRR